MFFCCNIFGCFSFEGLLSVRVKIVVLRFLFGFFWGGAILWVHAFWGQVFFVVLKVFFFTVSLLHVLCMILEYTWFMFECTFLFVCMAVFVRLYLCFSDVWFFMRMHVFVHSCLMFFGAGEGACFLCVTFFVGTGHSKEGWQTPDCQSKRGRGYFEKNLWATSNPAVDLPQAHQSHLHRSVENRKTLRGSGMFRLESGRTPGGALTWPKNVTFMKARFSSAFMMMGGIPARVGRKPPKTFKCYWMSYLSLNKWQMLLAYFNYL